MAGESVPRSRDGIVPLGPKYGTLLAVCLGIFVEPLQTTVVSIAFPVIQGSLGASFIEIQWVVNAYTLVAGALLLAAGGLADRCGRRRVFTIGLVLSVLTSILCGVATSPLMLILARALQGVAAAAVYTTTLALLVQEFEGSERAMVFGIWGAVVGLGFVLGPPLGGLVIQSLSWRWVFFAQVVPSLLAIGVTVATVRESSDPNAARVDWLGAVTSTFAFLLLIYVIVSSNDRSWTSPVITGAFIGGLVLLGVFTVVERRTPRPMMELSFFRDRTFTGASIVPVVLSISFFVHHLPAAVLHCGTGLILPGLVLLDSEIDSLQQISEVLSAQLGRTSPFT